MQRHLESRRHHESTQARPRQRALDESDSQNEQLSFDDARGSRAWDRDERDDALRAAQRSGDVAEQLEAEAPHTPRSYRPETGLSYDQYRRSRYYDGFEDGQLKAAPTPFRYRRGEYTAGGEPVERAPGHAHAAEEATVHTIALSPEDEQQRDACEREAVHHWPGARVLVDAVGLRYRAAVYLPEDGVQPDASAQQSAAHTSAGEALEELLRTLRSQPSLRSI